MRRSQLRPILVNMKSNFSSFELADSYMFQIVTDGIMKGINLEPSGFNKKMFYVEAFVIPLYVPRNHVSLLFSKRIETPDFAWFKTEDLTCRLNDAVENEALPYLANIETPLKLAETMLARRSGNPHVPHAIAFSLAKAGEHGRAIALIDDFLPKMYRTRDWEQRIFDQCTFFRDLLARDPDAAHRQLLAWEDYTVGQLGLEKFRAANRSR